MTAARTAAPLNAPAIVAGACVVALVAGASLLAWVPEAPLEPLDAGRPRGDRFWAWLFLAVAATGFLAYVGALAALARRGASGVAAVAALAATIQLAPLAAPLLLSTDAWTYWAYGRIAAVHGDNPYRDPPREHVDDPAFRYVGAAWRDSTSVYGPAFTLASEPIALVAGESRQAAAWTYKALAAASLLGAALLAGLLARRRAFAIAFVGWNPLLALHAAGGGHNDAWLAVLVLGALVLAARGSPQLGGAAWALAALVKWTPLLLLPLYVLERRLRSVGALGFAVAAGLVLALATWRYGAGWLEAFGPLARNANDETRFALPHRLEQVGVPEAAARALAGIGFVTVYVWLARSAWRGEARLGLAMVALLLATPYLAPWYLAWAVPLAAAEEDATAQVLTLALCAYLLPQTVPI